MENTKIFIGPMSKNIVDAVISYGNKYYAQLGLIASRRQIEDTGGYVNNWTTKEFCEYVRAKDPLRNILLVRDHGGPSQGNIEDDGIKSFVQDCQPNMFDIVHVDVWKNHKNYLDGLISTIKYIQLGYRTNPNVYYEIGTEESIRKTSSEELDRLISDLKELLEPMCYERIKYAVIQSGTALKGNENTGSFNQDRLIDMVNIVHKHGLIAKEHNGDYLTNELVKVKFKNGLDSINIAPEFGQIETLVILNEIKTNHLHLLDEFYKICLDSNRWVKWVEPDFNPEGNKEKLINICGHYVFSDPRFLELKKQLPPNIDDTIKKEIMKRIQELTEATHV